jgi:hypothetical protein
MKTYKFILLVLEFLLLNTIVAKAQDSIRYIHENDLTVGIPITKTEFDRKVSNYVKLMSDWTNFKPEDYADMVRLFNTIGDSNLKNIGFYRMYYEVFLVMYNKPAGLALNAKLMKGMSMYSKKFNIWIGDRPFGNNNSIYKIDTSK